MDPLPSRLQVVCAESERLTRYLATLSPAAWHHPSACTGWEVGDVVAHLMRGAEAYIEWITRGLHGDTAAPGPVAGTAVGSSSDARRTQRARDIRAQWGGQLFTTFQQRAEQFNTFIAGLSPQDWSVPCYHPTRLRPVRDFVALRLGELALHGWDIRSRLEADAHLSAESVPICLELLPDMLAWSFRPGPALSAPLRCHLVGMDQSPHPYDLVISGERAWLVTATTDAAPVTCQCAAETLVLLMSGRLSLPAAQTAGQLVVLGEASWRIALAQWFRDT